MAVDSDFVGRSLLILGALIALLGAGILFFSRIPFLGHLPGISLFGEMASRSFPSRHVHRLKPHPYRGRKNRDPDLSIAVGGTEKRPMFVPRFRSP